MTKVLFLHSASDLYGSSRVALNTIRVMINRGYEVKVLLPYPGPLSELLLSAGTRVEYTNLAVLRRKYLSLFGLINRAVKFIKAWAYLSQCTKEMQIDLIYTNTSVIWIGAFVARLKGIKHVAHLHEIPSNSGLFTTCTAWFMNKSEVIIAVSNGVKSFWSKRVKNIEIHRVYNGFDFLKNSNNGHLPKPDKFILLAVGRLQALKGQQYLIEITSYLMESRSDFEVWIVGSAFRGNEAYEVGLKKEVIRRKLEGQIKFLGQRNDVPQLLDLADILIHPSLNPDSLPTSILEALHAGTPVVATDLLGANEIIGHQKEGLLIPFNNALFSAKLISDLLDKPALRKKMVQAGAELIKNHFTLEKFNHQMNSIFSDVE